MTSFQLKTIAVISMLIDHIGAIFFPEIYFFRFLGRIAFPIYAFMLAEGFYHTYQTEKFWPYVKRMAVFSLISEICFDLAFSDKINPTSQNVFFTLTIGLLLLYFYEESKRKNKDGFIPVLLFCILSVILMTDYSLIGPLMIFIFYKSIKLKNKEIIFLAFIAILIYEYTVAFAGIPPFQFFNVFTTYAYVYLGTLLAVPFIWLYNGKLGLRNKFIKYFFYGFYPIHLLLLTLIKIFVK